MSHPAAPKLDALAAGDADATTEAHVRACAACTAYVVSLREEVAAFRAEADGDAFAAKVKTRAAKREKRETRGRVVWLAAPMLAAAAAAAVALWLGRPPRTMPFDPGASSSAGVSAGSHFKGGVAVIAIRDRGGRQERLTGPFNVRAGDRVRVEVSVDRDAPVVAGLLASDGTWTPLLAAAELAEGTHYSELAARFDDAPVDAFLLAGAPSDVEHARATRRFEDVVAWRVGSQPPE